MLHFDYNLPVELAILDPVDDLPVELAILDPVDDLPSLSICEPPPSASVWLEIFEPVFDWPIDEPIFDWPVSETALSKADSAIESD